MEISKLGGKRMLKEIKKGNPLGIEYCPICGHTGWCATFVKDDELFIICKRDVSKMDTNGYTYLSNTRKEGNSFFVFDPNGQRKSWEKPISSPVSHPPKYRETKSFENKPFPDDMLNMMYRDLLSMLILEDEHRLYLHREGFTDQMITRMNIKSWPASDKERYENHIKTRNPKRYVIGKKLHEKYGDLTGLPGAYLAENKKNKELYWTFTTGSGIIFPIENIYGEVVTLQMRLDRPSRAKYKIFSSAEYYLNGSSPGSRIGIIKPKEIADSYLVYLTEGIKKAGIIAERLGVIALTIQGVNSWSELFTINYCGERLIDILRLQYNIKMVVLALDNDKYNNQKVMAQQENIRTTLKKEGFLVSSAEWDSYMGKGIDDMLNNGYRPMYVLLEG